MRAHSVSMIKGELIVFEANSGLFVLDDFKIIAGAKVDAER